LIERDAAMNNANIDSDGTDVGCVQRQIGNLSLAQEIGALINIRHAKVTVIHCAAVSFSVDIIKLQLDKGISVNLTHKIQLSPLHISAKFGHLEVTKCLIKRIAVINNTKNPRIMVVAFIAKLETFFTSQTFSIILIYVVTTKALLFTRLSSRSVWILSSFCWIKNIVKLTNRDDYTALHVSVQFGRLEVTKNFVEKGAAINNSNSDDDTPLMMAAYRGKLEIFSAVVEIVTVINIRDDNSNNTTLHLAAESCSVDIIKLLLDKYRLLT
jgi:ankyrin repeat protein